jgi:hypothetical protein
MNIKQIFDEISAESSTNKKVEILNKYKDNELLKKVLYLANSKRVKFYIKQVPNYISVECETLEWGLDSLNPISERKITGNEAIGWLTNILSRLSADDAYVIERIIEKDCRINVGRHLINKVWPNLIEITPYQGCKPYSIKLVKKLFEKNGSAILQTKMDGRYSAAIIRGGDVELESRQGETTWLEGAIFNEELKCFDDCVLNGEFTISSISRYKSNGIVASLVSIGNKILKQEDVTKDIVKLKEKHGYEYQEALDAIQYTCWDMITVDEHFNAYSKVPYRQRLENLKNAILKAGSTKVRMIDGCEVSSCDEAMAKFQELLNSGEEGAVIKAIDGEWVDGKHNHQIKMKLEIDVDLKITGFNYGTGKNSNVISSVNAASSDGLVNTRPTGIDEKTMLFITENQEALLGTIIEVKCCGLSVNNNGEYSLLHPVFKGSRAGDKDSANSLDEIKEIERMAKELS